MINVYGTIVKWITDDVFVLRVTFKSYSTLKEDMDLIINCSYIKPQLDPEMQIDNTRVSIAADFAYDENHRFFIRATHICYKDKDYKKELNY